MPDTALDSEEEEGEINKRASAYRGRRQNSSTEPSRGVYNVVTEGFGKKGDAGTGVTGSSAEQEGWKDGGCKAGGARGHGWVRMRGEERRPAVPWPEGPWEQIKRVLL